MKRFGLKLDFYEPWLFTWREENKFLILVLYVDDILLASNDSVKLKEIKVNLKKNFDMTDIGEPVFSWFGNTKRQKTSNVKNPPGKSSCEQTA